MREQQITREQFIDYIRASLDSGVIVFADAEVAALLARIAELEAERHSTNEALTKAVKENRAKDGVLAAVRDAVAEAIMCGDRSCLTTSHLPKLERILGGVGLLRDTEAVSK